MLLCGGCHSFTCTGIVIVTLGLSSFHLHWFHLHWYCRYVIVTLELCHSCTGTGVVIVTRELL